MSTVNNWSSFNELNPIVCYKSPTTTFVNFMPSFNYIGFQQDAVISPTTANRLKIVPVDYRSFQLTTFKLPVVNTPNYIKLNNNDLILSSGDNLYYRVVATVDMSLYGYIEYISVQDYIPTVTQTNSIPIGASVLLQSLQNSLGLPDGQVLFYNNDYVLPVISDLFCIVQPKDSKIYANNIQYQIDSLTGDLQEVLASSKVTTYTINLMSRDNSALESQPLVLNALISTFCKQLCESNAVAITNITKSFDDVSGAEGGSSINRFAIDVLVWTINSTVNTLTAGQVITSVINQQVSTDLS